MWMLHFIPDSLLLWVIHSVLITGVVGFLLSFFLLNRLLRWFPQFAPIHVLLQIISIALLVAGVYFEGGYNTEAEWRARVAEVEAKVAVAEIASKEANVKLDAERKKKQKVRKEYYATIKERIVEKEKIIDAKCELDLSVPQILNDAAKNPNKKGTVTIEEVKK